MEKRLIYMDNAATSFPKADGVAEASAYYLTQAGVNVARGGYSLAYEVGETVFQARKKTAEMFGVKDPHRVIFTAGATTAINMMIKGLLRAGDKVLVSSLEHNAVMRPLNQIKADFYRVKSDGQGVFDFLDFKTHLKGAKAVVLTHASNVCGTIQPIEEVASQAKKEGVFVCIDAAQTAGAEKIDFDCSGFDALAFSAHKGLMAAPGLGCLLLSERLAETLDPLISGGTGSVSDTEEIPPFLPDKFESGTPNLAGIYALNAALDFVSKNPVKDKIMNDTAFLIDGLKSLDGLRLVGLETTEGRTGVVSVDFKEKDNADAAYFLESEFGIMTRCGMHCAPSAHKTLGTFPQGTVRFSPGFFTSKQDLETVLYSIGEFLK